MNIYEIVGIKKEDVPFSQSAHNCTQNFVHYYRVKDAYDSSVNKLKYHYYEFKVFPYKYNFIYENKIDNIQYMLYYLRNQKNDVLKPHVLNYRFFYYDKDKVMYYATKNVIKEFYRYTTFISDKSLYNPEEDDIYAQNMIDAYSLLFYLIDRAPLLSDYEMEKLMNENFNKSPRTK